MQKKTFVAIYHGSREKTTYFPFSSNERHLKMHQIPLKSTPFLRMFEGTTLSDTAEKKYFLLQSVEITF